MLTSKFFQAQYLHKGTFLGIFFQGNQRRPKRLVWSPLVQFSCRPKRPVGSRHADPEPGTQSLAFMIPLMLYMRNQDLPHYPSSVLTSDTGGVSAAANGRLAWSW